VRDLLAFSSSEVADASVNEQLTETPEAVIVVLERFARDESQATDVLWWAEVVRYGHVAGNCRRWKPLDICARAKSRIPEIARSSAVINIVLISAGRLVFQGANGLLINRRYVGTAER
jgi:hypothetical protein